MTKIHSIGVAAHALQPIGRGKRNSNAWRNGFAAEPIRTPYNNTRRKLQWRRTVLGWLWTVIDDFGGVYGSGRSKTKKSGKEEARTIVRPPKKPVVA